jgi:hypothetical protein
MAAGGKGVSESEVAKGRERLKNALEPSGLLLVHDNDLPAATTVITGDNVRGSWWGHKKGNLIYAVLENPGDDFEYCKLIKGKDTLVARPLWAALAAIGLSRQAWQVVGLGPAGRWVWEQVQARGVVSQRELAEEKAIPGLGAVMTDLQKRLLVHGLSEHTDAGQHQKTLKSWPTWQNDRHIAAADVPSVEAAVAAFHDAVRSWGTDLSNLFPWSKAAQGAPSRAKRSPPRG